MQQFNDASIMETYLSHERVFDGIILNIDHAVYQLPNGKPARREIARHLGAVAVLPIDDEKNVYLVRQFRAPLDKVLLEIPAGKLDSADEDRLEAAKRELSEETGLDAGEWRFLADTYNAAGYSSECISLYLARGLKKGESHPDEDEFLNVIKMPFDELYEMVMRGEIRDAKTQITLLMAKNLI